MQGFYGYVRVSTVRQGERGVSLQEQRSAIQRYAERNDIQISEWFEERLTAAKSGRPQFTQMLKLLRHKKAAGVVIHKIDRSTRNLTEWAQLGDLIDGGVDVRFVSESLDMNSRGGRLSADLQAVVAADYIRNLRDETRKGIYGRLKQGLLPTCAPLGYLNNGSGKPKTICPQRGPLVKRAFELYATGKYDLESLAEKLDELGLRTTAGNPVCKNRLSLLLNNPFYMGVIRLRRTGETFPGIHKPLVSALQYGKVQDTLQGKRRRGPSSHDFLYRGLLNCKRCGRSLSGERQKGHVYYRCHKKACRGTSVRQEAVNKAVDGSLKPLQFSGDEKNVLVREAEGLGATWEDARKVEERRLTARHDVMINKLARLTDAYVEGVLEIELFMERKKALLVERLKVEALLKKSKSEGVKSNRLADFIQLAGSAYLSYKMAEDEEKQDLLKNICSNRWVDGKNVIIELHLPFAEVANRPKKSQWWAGSDAVRTFLTKLSDLLVRIPTGVNPSDDTSQLEDL